MDPLSIRCSECTEIRVQFLGQKNCILGGIRLHRVQLDLQGTFASSIAAKILLFKSFISWLQTDEQARVCFSKPPKWMGHYHRFSSVFFPTPIFLEKVGCYVFFREFPGTPRVLGTPFWEARPISYILGCPPLPGFQ